MLVRTYGPVFMLLAAAALVAALFFSLASVLGKKNPTAEKNEPYECGSESSGAGTSSCR
jgi:NADH-quinone oxidoreductase subunit A